MEMVDELSQAKKRVEPQKSCMDSLPEEVIGTILSHVASARNVTRACATSCKWLKAAKDHLHMLTFDESDFVAKHGGLISSICEDIITQTILKTSCLHGLSICVKSSSRTISFQAAVVTAWLLHTKKTLTSLTFRNPIKPRMNILEKLGGGQSKLQHLEWGSAYIPALDPSIHRFESLISLILSSMETWLTASNLQALLVVCPNLESLSLIGIHIWEEEGRPLKPTIDLKSSSLQALSINAGFDGISRIILHMDGLESLWLEGVEFEQVKLVQDKGHGNLKQLQMERASIEELEIGRSAGSLHEVNIKLALNLQAEWPRYYQAISGAINLRELHLSLNVPRHNKSILDLSQISSTFPHLESLALAYQHAPHAFNDSRSAVLLMFPSVRVLELVTHRFHTGFAEWIGEFLKRCPKLKRLTIFGKACWGGDDDRVQEMADYTSSLVALMRPYPHIDIKIQYI